VDAKLIRFYYDDRRLTASDTLSGIEFEEDEGFIEVGQVATGKSRLTGRNVLSRDCGEIIKVNTQPRKIAPIFYCMFGAYVKHISSISGT
jgi:hypothetical protein